jgi:MGT family glycosyltransferase
MRTAPRLLKRSSGRSPGSLEFTSKRVTNIDSNHMSLEHYNRPIHCWVNDAAVITQTPREFDFPIPHLPPQFHYAGPFQLNQGREPVPFPWEKLTDKPLVYASMGTLVNGLKNVYSSILEAVGEFRQMQVVLSVGRNIGPGDLGPIPSNAIVVSIAPQIELLKRAALCITHAGLNTTLEALAEGVPMVAIPIGYDQPGVASRIAYHGVLFQTAAIVVSTAVDRRSTGIRYLLQR